MAVLACLIGLTLSLQWLPYYWVVARYSHTIIGLVLGSRRFFIVPLGIALYALFLLLQTFGMEETTQKEAAFITLVLVSLIIWPFAMAYVGREYKARQKTRKSRWRLRN
jgi:hypothetical protein